MLLADIVHGERRKGDSVLCQRRPERAYGGMAAWLKDHLNAVRLLPGDDRQPPVLAHRYLGLLQKAERLRVERERLLLIFGKQAR